MFKWIKNFRLPLEPNPMRQIWINEIKKHQQFGDHDKCSLTYHICILHFDPTLIKRTPSVVKLLPDVYPTIFPPVPPGYSNSLVTNDLPVADDLIGLPEEMDIASTETAEQICSDPVWYANFVISRHIALYSIIFDYINTFRSDRHRF